MSDDTKPDSIAELLLAALIASHESSGLPVRHVQDSHIADAGLEIWMPSDVDAANAAFTVYLESGVEQEMMVRIDEIMKSPGPKGVPSI